MPLAVSTFDAASPLPADIIAFWRAALTCGSPEAALTASPEWFRVMAEGQLSGSACHVVRDEAGRPVAVFPCLAQTMPLCFSIAGLKFGCRSLSILRVTGGDLVEDGLSADDLRAFWGHLFARHPAVDAVWLDHVQAGRRQPLVLDSVRRHPDCFAVAVQTQQPHYYARLHPGGEGMARSKESRRRLSRYERALAVAHGAVRVTELRTETELMARAAAIEGLMNNAWQAEWLGMGADLKAQIPVARAGLLRSWLLEAGGKPVAFLLGYQGHGVVCLHQIGYAQAMAKFSPGTLLLTHVMDTLAGEGPLVVDFGSGEAGYKKHFTNETGWSSRILIVRKTPKLRLIVMAYQMVSALDRFVRAVLKRLKIKDWLVRRLKRRSGK